MEFITLTCPRCYTRMTVAQTASQRLICPRCLGLVKNTSSRQRAPIPVIPVATETSRDNHGVAIMVVAVAAAILVGAVMAFGNPGTNAGKVILISVLALAIISSINSATRSRPSSTRQPTDQFGITANPIVSVIKIISAAIIGIILTLLLLFGLCAGGILVLSHL